MNDASNDCPPAVSATGGQHIAVGANAVRHYANDAETGKRRFDPAYEANVSIRRGPPCAAGERPVLSVLLFAHLGAVVGSDHGVFGA